MFEYYNNIASSYGSTIKDLYKQVDFSDLLSSDDYIYHKIVESENLMNISYKYYKTIDNWWIIAMFNNINDINFFNPNNNTIDTTINDYLSKLINYYSLPEKEKAIIKALIRDYYLSLGNNTKESIINTNNSLLNITNIFVSSFKEYLLKQILNESFYIKELKIPIDTLANKIKNRYDTYSVTWNS